MSQPVAGLGRIQLGINDQSSGSREEMEMWPDCWEFALSILLEDSGSSESLSLDPHPQSPPHPSKFLFLYLKTLFTNQTLGDLKPFSVWLLLLNGPKSFFVLGRANLAIHREAISL